MDFSALTLSTGVVALAEMGDKTQLLSLMLAARYPKHALAIPDVMRWILGSSF